MSSPSIHSEPLSEPGDGQSNGESTTVFRAVRQRILDPLRVLGFWTAIALPFLYVPLLATGLDTVAQTIVFLGLLGLNLVALLIGHSYSPG